MIALVFGLIALCWGAMCLYFLWRLWLRRKPQSLVIALACLSPVVHVARELEWLPRAPTTFFLATSLAIGLLGVVIVLHYESQSATPFR